MKNTTEIRSNPLKAWKLLQHEYPMLTNMASDVLAIPASEVGIQRLFNIGRDVCHYRRNRLTGKTIEDMMMVKLWKQIQGDIFLPSGFSHSASEAISVDDEPGQVDIESLEASDSESLGEDEVFYLDEENTDVLDEDSLDLVDIDIDTTSI
jgi:hAT family C-terminal dimerisation region